MARVVLEALPAAEAIAFFQAKHNLPSFDWQDLWQREHAAAFTVAKSAGFDILGDIRAAVDEALEGGLTVRDFRKRLEPILAGKGWWGRREVTDPLTGELRQATLGTPRRLETIYRTNLRTAHAAGQWERIERRKARRPWLEYLTVGDERVRESHARWHGLVLPVDDPFWRTHAPPNGWSCFPGDQVVRCDARLGLKTLYSGEMVQLRTASGRRLTVTANHPVLARVGWIPAREIQEGDELLGASIEVDASSARIVEDKQAPASAEDLFESLAAQGLRSVPMAVNDFHGDALCREPEIHVAGADRDLVDVIQAALGKDVGEGRLTLGLHGSVESAGVPGGAAQASPVVPHAGVAENFADARLGHAESASNLRLAGQSGPVERQHAALGQVVAGIGGGPSFAELALDAARGGLDGVPFDALGLGSAAQADASSAERPGEGASPDAGLFGELLQACAGFVATDEVVEIVKFDWSGHVYDFVTETGLIVAGGVLVSNCRCVMVQRSDRDLERLGLRPGKAPPVETRAWKNRRTGKVERVPVGIDPGWAYNPGAVRGEQLGRVLADKLEAMPEDLARGAVRSMLAGPGARRLMAGKADAIPLPVAVLPPAIGAALGAQGRVAMLSAATATKQLGKRRPVEAYALAQLALDEGDLWLEHGGTHVAAFIEIDGKLWQVAIKRTLDGREIYLVSLHRADAKNVRRAARAGRKLER